MNKVTHRLSSNSTVSGAYELTHRLSTNSTMSGALAHPASSQDHQQQHENANGDQNNDYVDSHIVELSEIIDREIRSHTWESTSDATIFRVPRPNNEKLQSSADKMMSTYDPSFISIGPYHVHATEEMRRTEQGKLCVLDRCIPQGGRPSVLEYTQAVKSMEADARLCYEGDVGMDPNAFCRMLLLDAVQLILLLELFANEDDAAAGPDAGGTGTTGAASPSQGSSTRTREDDAAEPPDAGGTGTTGAASPSQGFNAKTRDIIMTVRDIMMLENQIPFCVVEKIYELQKGNAAKMNPVSRLAWKSIRNIVSGLPSWAPNDDDLPLMKFQHLVHVCHVYLKPTCLNSDASTENLTKKTGKYARFLRATEYYEAGVTFRRWDSKAGSQCHRPVLDVAFNNGVLSVALQVIHENTACILGNVLAYEQKYNRTATSPDTSYVTAYVVFMSQLLRSAEDVALLSRLGVVENLLGDDAEVCALFRGLAYGLAFDPSSEHYLSPVQLALQAHCRHRRHRWRAWIVRHRLSNPWLVAAWLFGGSAVLCTIIQTVFTVLSYVQQPH